MLLIKHQTNKLKKIMAKTLKDKISDKLVNAFLKIKLFHQYLVDLQKNLMRQINLENYVKAKSKTQL